MNEGVIIDGGEEEPRKHNSMKGNKLFKEEKDDGL